METPLKKYKNITIHFTIDEYDFLHHSYVNSIHRTLSDYVKRRIFAKPITVTYRDRSFDDFIEMCIQFKKELDKIPSLNGLTEDEKEWLNKEVATIKETIIKIYDYVRQNTSNKEHIE